MHLFIADKKPQERIKIAEGGIQASFYKVEAKVCLLIKAVKQLKHRSSAGKPAIILIPPQHPEISLLTEHEISTQSQPSSHFHSSYSLI